MVQIASWGTHEGQACGANEDAWLILGRCSNSGKAPRLTIKTCIYKVGMKVRSASQKSPHGEGGKGKCGKFRGTGLVIRKGVSRGQDRVGCRVCTRERVGGL